MTLRTIAEAVTMPTGTVTLGSDPRCAMTATDVTVAVKLP
jgi:hypothetical protein